MRGCGKRGKRMFSYKQLLAFVTVVETGGFTIAAKTLYMTQPAISWQIKSLEEDVGFRLIERGERSVCLTEAGKLFFRNARKILNQYDSLQNDILQYRNLEKGHLKTGASTIPGEYLLPEFIGAFKTRFPGVNLSMEIADSAAILEKLADEEIAIGIVGSRPYDPNLEAEPFSDDRLHLVAHPDHPLCKQKGVKLKDVIGSPLVLREEGSGTRTELLSALKKNGISKDRLNVQMELGSTRASITAVESGLGLSWISEVAFRDAEQLGKVRRIQLEDFDVTRTFYVVHVRNRTLSPLGLSFKGFLQEKRKQL